MTSLFAQAFCLSAAVSICFCQDDQGNVRVAPRVVQHSPSTDVRPPDSTGSPLKVDVNLVLVPVTVTDQRDHLVIGLQKDACNILDQSNQEVIHQCH